MLRWPRLAEFLLPTRCVLCQRVGAAVICAECRGGLEAVGTHCLRCGRRRETAFASPDCGECFGESLGVTRARSLYLYNEPGRALLREFKFRRHLGVGRLLAADLLAWVRRGWAEVFDEPDCAFDALVPVPLFRGRLRERRFNQAELIARGLGRGLGLSCEPHWLGRMRRTPSQVGLTANQRKLNVRGAFNVPARRRPCLAGKRVLLVDDLMTTGATLAACARALRRGGAGSIHGLTLFCTHRAVEPAADA